MAIFNCEYIFTEAKKKAVDKKNSYIKSWSWFHVLTTHFGVIIIIFINVFFWKKSNWSFVKIAQELCSSTR